MEGPGWIRKINNKSSLATSNAMLSGCISKLYVPELVWGWLAVTSDPVAAEWKVVE